MSLTIAMLMLRIIIMIYGFGHSLFIKLNGVGVTELSLDMGPKSFSFEKDGIRCFLKILPFGGPCMVLGEDEGITDGSVFNNKSVWARVSVVAAGPVLNLILAFGSSMVPIGITGYNTTRLAGVVDGYPAQAAGIEAGDVIKSINGRKVHSYRDVSWYPLTHLQKSLKAIWERTEERGETERFSTELEPALSTENNQYMMGAQLNPVPSAVENIGQLLVYSAYEVQYWIRYVFGIFYMMFHGMVSVNDVSDSVGIVNAIDTTMDETASYGLPAVVLVLINFTTFLNVNLGVMNLLPIPILDGGCSALLIIEAVGGESIDKGKEGIVYTAGMMVPLALMMLTLFNDVRKLS